MNFDLWDILTAGFSALTLGNIAMMAIGGLLIYLGVAKEYE